MSGTVATVIGCDQENYWNSVGRGGQRNYGSYRVVNRIITLKVLSLFALVLGVPASGVVAANTGPPLLSTDGHLGNYKSNVYK